MKNFIRVHELSTYTRFWTTPLFTNISGTDQAINKRKTALATMIFSMFDKNNFVNFGPLTCSCVISSSSVQRFVRYCANTNRQKNSDENNTICHYHVDSKNTTK